MENLIEQKSNANVEIIINNLESLSYKEYNPDEFLEDTVLEEVERSSLDDISPKNNSGLLFEDKLHKELWLKERKANFNSTKVISEKEKEIIKELTPLERIQKLRNDFLNQLEANDLKKFDADYFWADNQPVGVFASMFVVGKNQLEYTVNSVVKSSDSGGFERSESGVLPYKEKISLSKSQLNNFIKLIEENIEKIKNELKKETNNSVASSYSDWLNRLEDTVDILKNGKVKEDYDPRIVL